MCMQTTEEEMQRKEKGVTAGDHKAGDEEVLYKIDIPANRYDMLCLEGIARALNLFNRRIKAVEYRLADMAGEPCAHATAFWLAVPCMLEAHA